MARGFTWCIYVDDLGAQWALQVDSDYAADPDRGWFVMTTESLPPFPRGWRPRRVRGVDETGRIVHAVAGSLAAAIWSGLVSTFIFNANDGTPMVAAITDYIGEFRTPTNPDPAF